MTSPNGQRAERDGCGCPPWVKRCAHWEGALLTLDDHRIGRALHACGRDFSGDREYGVCNREPSDFQPAPCGCSMIMGDGAPKLFDDLPAAEAEFRRREAAMLGRDVE